VETAPRQNSAESLCNARTLWVVGDARQAIYRFRGASLANSVHFKNDYQKHQVFPLNENRRSYEEVVKVFEHTGREANPLQMMTCGRGQPKRCFRGGPVGVGGTGCRLSV